MNSSEFIFSLYNGVKMPAPGFGTWRASKGLQAENAVSNALESGYRHIDTAAAYQNEESIGKSIKQSGIPREEIFVTSKLWTTNRGYSKALSAFDETLNRLGLEYLDLYLIHWPANHVTNENWDEINLETWHALEKLYTDGKVRAIGVSNFMTKHLNSLLKSEIIPMVNQIEYHPGFMQQDVVNLCKENNILVEAWSPLGAGRVLDNPDIKLIADKYEKSVAQICIRWCLQNGVCPLPKSVNKLRIVQNFDVFDFEISGSDMEFINNMATFGESGHDPDTIEL